jgi:hypothetical protein
LPVDDINKHFSMRETDEKVCHFEFG